MTTVRDDKNMQFLIALFAVAHRIDVAAAQELAECAYQCGIGEGIKRSVATINKTFEERQTSISKAMEAREASLRG